jgi:hypothetical protein
MEGGMQALSRPTWARQQQAIGIPHGILHGILHGLPANHLFSEVLDQFLTV